MCVALNGRVSMIKTISEVGYMTNVLAEWPGRVAEVHVNVGDTVFWKATTKGHNVEFIKGGFPIGVEKFKSKMNKDAEYKFTVPGIYAYWCTPHKSMGMIGFVVVDGDKSNIETIKALKFFGKSKKIAPDLINQL